MVKYDFIKKLEKDGDLCTAIKMGVVSTTIGSHKVIYETYLKNKSSNKSKELAYQLTADDCRCSTINVKRIVSDFSRNI